MLMHALPSYTVSRTVVSLDAPRVRRRKLRDELEYSVSIEKVRAFLRSYGIDGRIMEFETSSATVELAAAAVGCEPMRIAKTLAFLVDEQAIVIVTAGDAKIDNGKFKAQFRTKAKMLSPEQTKTMVGHAVGGVCPFAVNDGVRIFLDESLKRFETVFPAAGTASSAVEVSHAELERIVSPAGWINVCKSWPQAGSA